MGSGTFVLMIFSFVGCSLCDIYMHNPRGSNNRLDEESRERTTDTRLFDSQNNARGGYNVGSLYYHTGSTLPIEWTNQHSCGDINCHCEIILQYACGVDIRDGATIQRIPNVRSQCASSNCQTDPAYGLHESYDHYLRCSRRLRNQGLFTADQKLNGRTAQFTRQNPAGTRYGYECPEERDYYPYWHHSPWTDIAVLTNDPSRCQYYQSESANVKDRFECRVPASVLESNGTILLPISQSECLKVPGASWDRQAAWNVSAPVCRTAESTRDNHLGDTARGVNFAFNWTVPEELAGQKCILRVRYNVSTGDYDRWGSFADQNNNNQLDLMTRLGFANKSQTDSRGYRFQNNPQVQIFADSTKFKLQVNLNTAQFGRVFQDRSHVFYVRPRPEAIPAGAEILNLNVRGKRGNIVQVYPAVEYDFVPQLVQAKPGSFVHPQWTGSNTNNPGNAGQGLARTDRSNMLPLHDLAANVPNISATMDWTLSGLASWSSADLANLALLSQSPQLGGSTRLLNDAGTYFDLGARRVSRSGEWYYTCTRNNNFSNRSHKGRMVCSSDRADTFLVDSQASSMKVTNGTRTLAEVSIPSGAFSGLRYLQLRVTPTSTPPAASDGSAMSPSTSSSSGASSSDVYGDTWFTGQLRIEVDGLADEAFEKALTVTMATSDGTDPTGGQDVQIYRMNAEFSTAMSHQGSLDSASPNWVTFTVSRPGVYAARGFASSRLSVVGLVAGIVGALALIGAVLAVVLVHRRNPEYFPEKLRFLQRSTQSEV